MKNKSCISNVILNKWQQNFKLKYKWASRIPAALAAAYSLSLLAEKVESGYYLAEQELRIKDHPILNSDFDLESEINSKRDFSSFSYFKLRSTVSNQDNLLIKLNSKLIKIKKPGVKTKNNFKIKPKINKKIKKEWRVFNQTQIKQFADLSGDLNSIHLNSNPVVQGMLILLCFEDYLAAKKIFLKKIKIKYYRKIKANQKIKLTLIENDKYLGMVGNKINFEIKIKENLNV